MLAISLLTERLCARQTHRQSQILPHQLHEDDAAPQNDLVDIPNAPKAALATASVADRWTIVIRALSSVACQDARPEQLQHLFSRAHEICAAHAAEIDNVVQDDKGLLIIITLPPSQALHKADRDALLKTLITGRAPLVRAGEVESGHGVPLGSSHAI